jgi:HEAT repeat protein
MVSVAWRPYCRNTMGDPSNGRELGLDQLRSALASADPSIRARALLRAPTAAGTEALVILALQDPEPEVRLAAIYVLARLRGPRGTRAIIEASSGDLSPAVRSEALAALSRILETRAPHLGRSD